MSSEEEIGGCNSQFIQTASEFKWILHNFSLFNEKKGQSISSPIFSSHILQFNSEIKWRLELYPNGADKGNNNKGYISIYLRCLTAINVTNINVFCEFTLGSNMKAYFCHKFHNTYIKKYDIAGCTKAINRNTLLNDLKNQNDQLIVLIKIVFSNSKSQIDTQVNLKQDIASLLKNGEHSDLTLVSSDGIQHKAHKLILICRSKVFLAMFQHNMKESQENVVTIEDIDSDTLKALLEFIYTGDVKYMQQKARQIRVLIAADKYELHDLKKICINDINENHHMLNDNIFDWINFAYTYNIDELKIEATKYFSRNRKIIMSTEECKKIKLMSREALEDLFCNISKCGD